jgi:hypothetical protein
LSCLLTFLPIFLLFPPFQIHSPYTTYICRLAGVKIINLFKLRVEIYKNSHQMWVLVIVQAPSLRQHCCCPNNMLRKYLGSRSRYTTRVACRAIARAIARNHCFCGDRVSWHFQVGHSRIVTRLSDKRTVSFSALLSK